MGIIRENLVVAPYIRWQGQTWMYWERERVRDLKNSLLEKRCFAKYSLLLFSPDVFHVFAAVSDPVFAGAAASVSPYILRIRLDCFRGSLMTFLPIFAHQGLRWTFLFAGTNNL